MLVVEIIFIISTNRKQIMVVKLLISPNGENYPIFRKFILNKFRPYSWRGTWTYRTRNGLSMKWSSRPRTIWGWGLQRNRLGAPPVSFNIKRLVKKQVLKNSNLGSFLKYWKGQKREPRLI